LPLLVRVDGQYAAELRDFAGLPVVL